MSYGFAFDPAESAPALIAVIVGGFVWMKHRADRRARLFLALASVEFAYGVPLSLAAASMPPGRWGQAALEAMVLGAGLASTVLFMHFGYAFPHARPSVRRGRFRMLYWISLAAALAAFAIGLRAGEGNALTVSMVVLAAAVLAAVTLACLAIHRSYREMSGDERVRYRVPVMGLLAAMIAGFMADVLVGVLFADAYSVSNRNVLWTTNLLSTASELLFPLFFFMAASKYKLLEHHSQDYVAKL